MSNVPLHWLSALELVELQVKGKVSATEILESHLAQIEAVNPAVNAIITLAEDRARELARKADAALRSGTILGPLHGVPVAHKDLTPTRGIRTTYGSRLFADYVPDHDSLTVERLVAAGAVTVGKTNVPEFGAGIQTTNDLFGPTRNPYDLSRTAGGSSGGAAAAVACGMVPFADGSDTGGSLRNPATFCNVVGFRPSLGTIPMWPTNDPLAPLTTHGPIARTVADVTTVMRVMSARDRRSPWGVNDPERFDASRLQRDFSESRIAWSDDLGGQLDVDTSVREAMQVARTALTGSCGAVVDAAPDFTGADEVFRTLRGWYRALNYGERYQMNPEAFGMRVSQDIRSGLQTTSEDLMAAHKTRGELMQRFGNFMADNEYLVTVVTQVEPWNADVLWPETIGGTVSENYLDCMKSMYWFTVLGVPAVSVPAGFTAAGLPVGVQIVGRHGDDFGVLQLAARLEASLKTYQVRPRIAVGVASHNAEE